MPIPTLVPIDGSPESLVAVRLAAALSSGASLRLVHATPSAGAAVLGALDEASTIVSGSPGVLAEEWHRRRELEATALLVSAREAALAVAPSLEVHTDHVSGRPADVILDRIAAHPSNVTVMGSRSRGPVARALLGSVGSEVLDGAASPVIVARRDRVRSVLLGVDGSQPSLRAATLAAEIARATGARLKLFTAFEFPIDTYAADRKEVEAAFEKRAHDFFAAARASMHVLPDEASMEFHEPSHALVVEAERGDFDLVVVGRRGRTEGGRFTLGSVSRRVALDAACSVLVVP